LLSSARLVGGVFAILSVATSFALVINPSDAFVVGALVIGRGSVMLVLALRLLMLMLLVSGAAPPPPNLVVLLRYGVGWRLLATRRYMCQCRQGPLLGVA
jgi:hypothetical protein